LTPDKFEFVKSKSVNVCKVSEPSALLLNVDAEMIGNDKENLIKLLKDYSAAFIDGIPCTKVNTGEMTIRLIGSNKTVQRRPYRLSPNEKEIVRERITEFLNCNIIRPSCSPYASPILLVKMKNGSDRLYVDYRELNSNTVSDRYPLPLINDQIARLASAKYFTCLDMASGYHQIPIHPDSVDYTAFVKPDGH